MPESIIANVAAEVAKAELVPAEKKFMKLLEQNDVKVQVIVPEDINPEDFRGALSAICKSYAKAEYRRELLFPALGQIMLVAKAHKELWDQQHENYEKFVEATEAEFGVSRSTLYEARKAVERFGAVLDLEQFPLVGRHRLKICSGLVPKGAEKEATAKKLLKVAQTESSEKLEEFISANYHQSRSERVGTTFEIECNKKQASYYEKFFSNAKIQAYVGSDKAAAILDALIAECSQTWIDDGEEKMDGAETKGAGAD